MGKTKRETDLPESVTPLIAPLLAVQRKLTHFHNQGVIIGGVAVSLLGKPRFTADVDAVLLLPLSDIPDVLKIASELGIQPRIAQVEKFARKNRVLLMRHDESGIAEALELPEIWSDIKMNISN